MSCAGSELLERLVALVAAILGLDDRLAAVRDGACALAEGMPALFDGMPAPLDANSSQFEDTSARLEFVPALLEDISALLEGMSAFFESASTFAPSDKLASLIEELLEGARDSSGVVPFLFFKGSVLPVWVLDLRERVSAPFARGVNLGARASFLSEAELGLKED